MIDGGLEARYTILIHVDSASGEVTIDTGALSPVWARPAVYRALTALDAVVASAEERTKLIVRDQPVEVPSYAYNDEDDGEEDEG